MTHENKVLSCLTNEPKHIDTLATETGLKMDVLLATLLVLEINHKAHRNTCTTYALKSTT